MSKIYRYYITKEEIHRFWDDWKIKNKELYDELITECNTCKTKDDLCLHHINCDKTDNSDKNLVCFCLKCHFSHHHKYGLNVGYIYEYKRDELINNLCIELTTVFKSENRFNLYFFLSLSS